MLLLVVSVTGWGDLAYKLADVRLGGSRESFRCIDLLAEKVVGKLFNMALTVMSERHNSCMAKADVFWGARSHSA